MTITLTEASVANSDEVQPGVILDYDETGRTIAIELLNASSRVDNPRSFSYNYAATPVLTTA